MSNQSFSALPWSINILVRTENHKSTARVFYLCNESFTVLICLFETGTWIFGGCTWMEHVNHKAIRLAPNNSYVILAKWSIYIYSGLWCIQKFPVFSHKVVVLGRFKNISKISTNSFTGLRCYISFWDVIGPVIYGDFGCHSELFRT